MVGLAVSSRGVLAAGLAQAGGYEASLAERTDGGWAIAETIPLPGPEVEGLSTWSVDHDGALAAVYYSPYEQGMGVLLVDAEDGLDVVGGWRVEGAYISSIDSEGDLTWMTLSAIDSDPFFGLVALDWSACR